MGKKEKVVNLEVKVNTSNADEELKKLNKEMENAEKLFNALQARFDDKKIEKSVVQIAKIRPILSELKGMSPELLKTASANNQKKLKLIQSEIDANKKVVKAVAETQKAEEDKSKAQEQNSKAATQATKENAAATKENAQAAKDATKATEQKAEATKKQTRLTKEQRKAEIEAAETTAKAIFKTHEAYKVKDELLKKQADIQRAQAELEIEELRKKGFDETEIEQQTAINKLNIDKQLKTDLKANAEEYYAQLKALQEFMLKPSTDDNGIVNVEKTKENVNSVVSILEEFRKGLLLNQNEVQLTYLKEEEEAKGNADKIAAAQKKKEKNWEEYSKKIKEINKEISKTEEAGQELRLKQWESYAKRFEDFMGRVNDAAKSVKEYTDTIFKSVSSASKAYTDGLDEELKHFTDKRAEQVKIGEEAEKRIATLEEAKKKATAENNQAEAESLQEKINEEKDLYDKDIQAKKDVAEKTKEIQRKKAKEQAKQEKIARIERKTKLAKDILEAGSNIAAGVTKALSYGPFLAPVLAAIVTTMGAIQIGIMTKNLAKFEKGGLLNGKRHSEGGMRIEGTNIEVEGGEYVVNRRSTAKNLGLISYINAQDKELQAGDLGKFFAQRPAFMPANMQRMMEEGGQIPQIDTPNSIDSEILDAIKAIDLQPRVAVTDIIRAQDQYASVENWSGV